MHLHRKPLFAQLGCFILQIAAEFLDHAGRQIAGRIGFGDKDGRIQRAYPEQYQFALQRRRPGERLRAMPSRFLGAGRKRS